MSVRDQPPKARIRGHGRTATIPQQREAILLECGMPNPVRVAVLAITRNGVAIGSRLAAEFPEMEVHAPKKLAGGGEAVRWYDDPTTSMVGRLFAEYDALVCVFSLGAVIRLVAPHLRDKKTDPAVLVIDDQLNHVISVLSGHIGGANQLALDIATKTGAAPVITTAADVNKTISVDMVGRRMGWVIEDDSTVTATSAHMVNGEAVGLYQDAGSPGWWDGPLPKNVTRYGDMRAMAGSGCRAFLAITDRTDIPDRIRRHGVVYRPPSLVAGVGLHRNTPSDKIVSCMRECLARHNLSSMSVCKLASLKKPIPVRGLIDAGERMGVPVAYVERDRLAQADAPNPSGVVEGFEGTPSVSEAAAMIVSGGDIIVEKQKFPPDLTLAVARIP